MPSGHIALGYSGGAPEATLVDLGDGRLHWWAWSKGELDSAGARAFAAELVRWADRQDAKAKREPLPGQLELFGDEDGA